MTSAQFFDILYPYPLVTVTQPINANLLLDLGADVIYRSCLKYELATDVSREDFDAAVTPELVVKPGKGVPVYLKKRTDIVE